MSEFLKASALARTLSRRQFVSAVTAAGALAGIGTWPAVAQSQSQSQPRKLTLAWSQASFCQVPVPIALERGFFEQNGIGT